VRGQRDGRGEGRADPGLGQVDAGCPGGAGRRRQWQLVKDAVGQEACIGAVEGGGEPVSDPGQPGDDLAEVVQAAPTAELFRVVDGSFEAQDVLALGVGLDLEHPEADAEPGKAVLRFLDHDFLRGRAGCPAAMRPTLQPEDGPHRGSAFLQIGSRRRSTT
jgi:hypothetical protein